jgi:hypothetical protein
LESLEGRTTPSVTIYNSFSGLDFNQSQGSAPPDTNAAAGPSNIVETVNQEVAIYGRTPGQATTDSFRNFWYTAGGLPQTSPTSFLSDPVVTYDDHVGRFIIGDQDVDVTNHVSNFDIAVSKSSNPATLTAADWNFYQISTTANGLDADYPGNMGYNGGALVVTFNMFVPTGIPGLEFLAYVQVKSVSLSDLTNGVSQNNLHTYTNNYNGFSLRPATMHDSTSATDPMWLVQEHLAGGAPDNQHIDVVEMTNVLSNSATFTTTTLAVNPYQALNPPLQPDGTAITTTIDSRIQKVAENGNQLVAAHAVGVSGTEDDIQWYQIDVSSGTPVLNQQGRISAGNNTYLTYPAVDINAYGDIGMTYMSSGTAQFMSMYVTGRQHTDPSGTMETPALVQAGATNYSNPIFPDAPSRAGDLAGINVDSDGSFWAANEFANTEAGANWGTAIAHFTFPVSFHPPLAPTEGQPLNAVPIAVFNDPFGPNLPASYQAEIQWGDGSTSFVTPTPEPNVPANFLISGSHTYTEEGNYPMTVTVTRLGLQNPPIIDTYIGERIVAVADAPLSETAVPVSATVNTPFTATVATFTDADPNGTATDYSATIHWGDGTTSRVAPVQDPTIAGQFDVVGTHTYAHFGPNRLSVDVSDAGGSTASTNSTANVYALVVAGDTGVTGNTITLDNLPNQPNSYEVLVNGQRRYSGLWSSVTGGIDLIPGNGVNTVNVEDVAAGVPVTVSLGSGTDTIAISPVAHTLDNIQGTVTVTGGTGSATLNVDDQNSTAVHTGTLTATTLQRQGAGQLTYTRTNTLDWSTGANQSITVQGTAGTTTINAAAGSDTVTVQGTAASTTTTIDTGSLDQIEVGTATTSLDAIHGSVTVTGQTGYYGALHIDDEAATRGRNYSLNTGSLSWGNPTAQVNFSLLYNFLLDGTNHGNTVSVTGSYPGFAVVLHGGNGTNTLVGPNTSNTWLFNGATDAVGTLNGYLIFEFFNHIVGGTGQDDFVFANGFSTRATLDGGGGMNWLDYSAYTTPVQVNLAARSATGVAGGAAGSLRRIENVVGGQGGNQLTGDQFGNVLMGGVGVDVLTAGSGNSILIGGGGNDQLIANQGTPGYDILIGGTTNYDNPTAANLAVLDAFFNGWHNTTAQNYGTQVSTLQAGVPVNGRLDSLSSSTVHLQNSGGTSFLGASQRQAALDWFFAAAGVRPPSLKNGEVVTTIS